MSKRLILLALLISVLFVACIQAAPTEAPAEETEAPVEETEAPAEETEAPAAGDQVEVFSWWTGGGEAAGLDAMIEVFNAGNPDIEFINSAVAGGAGTNARAVLASRLAASDPPDSWQAHAGQEIIGTYVAGSQIEALNDLYEAEGWLGVLPDTLIPLISQDGNIYSVPVNIHRANVMWYSPTVIADAGVEVPTTWDEFFMACEPIEAAGKICLSMGEQWTAMHLMEVVLLGELGPDAYNGLWDGTTDWGSAEVTAALETFNQVLEHVNSDASTLTWQDAAQLVANNDAAFNIMGDWVDGYFSGDTAGGNLGLVPGEGYGWAPPPGTDGVFQFLSDSFVLANGAPHPDAAMAWLKICGSKEGQEAFNPVKGSICARTDCDAELFNVYLKSAMEDWASDTVVGSLTHGVTANDSFKDEINTALGLFLGDLDVAAFQEALVAACSSAGPCQ
ncbi:MAG: carbohydrate ABC transporter substrate-binding protein [Anaerolineae bacterium]|nr:carbohydrate ABC transporter substrate-binding protein [Anaerolineae bacterium]